MPTISIVDPSAAIDADAVIVGVVKSGNGPVLAPGSSHVDGALGGTLLGALAAVDASGAEDEVVKIPTLSKANFPLVITTGLGEAGAGEAASGRRADELESIRRGVGAALRACDGRTHVHIAIDAGAADALGAIAEGALLGSYAYTTYKSAAQEPALKKITIGAEPTAAAKAELKRARIVAKAVAHVRDLVNAPPNDLYPATFADRAQKLAATRGLEVEVLDERALTKGKYAAILAVGSGSVHPPRLVRITYRHPKPRARIALVGKGITFDSGGLNLKTANMTWMKSDMGGGAAVIASVVAIAALKLPVEVIATVPMAENLPSGSSYRPSDVITMRDGRTIEVANTDAEGRLVLADGLLRAAADNPDHLIEISTLTGAQLVALGNRIIGAMGEPTFRDEVVAAGNAVGEASWAMPIPTHLRASLDSTVADIASLPSDRWAGMLVAATFLADFMPAGVPWVHLDIAGPSWNTGTAHGYTPKGATGAGVRTIVAAVTALAAQPS